MKYGTIHFLIFATLVISFGSCKAQKKATSGEGKEVKKEFIPATVPAVLTSQEDQAEFLAKNYWTNFDFADTTLINKPEFTEQIFVNYVYQVLQYTPRKSAQEGIKIMLDKAMIGDSLMFGHFVELSEKYFYDPNSPTRNEDFFLPVLQYITASEKVGEVDKIRPAFQLAMVMKNRVGDIANDFAYKSVHGQTNKMSNIKTDYTILYINNPGCHDCQRVKQYMSASPTLNSFMYRTGGNKATLTILAIYPDEDLKEWKEEIYPEKWTNGYDAGLTIKKGELYDLRAIPTLYLLDKERRVILKDAPIEMIEEWLSKNARK